MTVFPPKVVEKPPSLLQCPRRERDATRGAGGTENRYAEGVGTGGMAGVMAALFFPPFFEDSEWKK